MTEHSKSDLKRQHILETGRRLVIRHGFGGVGLSLLLRECGVPKGSFYHYFASKEAFGRAMLEDYVADYLARMDAILARDALGADKLLAFCAAWRDHHRQAGLANSCLVVKLGAEVADLSGPMRTTLDEGVQAFTARLAQMLRDGAADGSLHGIDDAEAQAATLYAQWLGAAILSKLSHDQSPLERALSDTKTRFLPTAEQGDPQ